MRVLNRRPTWTPVDDDISKGFAEVFGELKPEEEMFLLKTAQRRIYGPGEIILRENRPAAGIYVVAWGEVRVEFDHPDEARPAGGVEVARLGRGDIFGEISFIDRDPTSASVVAEDLVEILYVDETTIHGLLTGDPMFGVRFYKSLATTLASRLRATSRRVRMIPPSHAIDHRERIKIVG